MDNKGIITVKHYDKVITMTFDNGYTGEEFIEEVVEPLMLAMGYFPTTVYEATKNEDALEVLKEHDYDV